MDDELRRQQIAAAQEMELKKLTDITNLSGEEVEKRKKIVKEKLNEALEKGEVDDILRYFFINETQSADRTSQPITNEQIEHFSDIIKNLSRGEEFAVNFWHRYEESGYSVNMIMREFFGAYASVIHNSGPLYNETESPVVAQLIIDELSKLPAFENAKVPKNASDYTGFKTAEARAQSNYKNPIKLIRKPDGTIVTLDTAMDLLNSEDELKVLEFCTKENLDKGGQKQYRVREVSYHKSLPPELENPQTTQADDIEFFKADWHQKPTEWTKRFRKSLRDLSVYIESLEIEAVVVTEGGGFKGTMTNDTDIDTYVHIIGEETEDIKTKIQKEFDELNKQNNFDTHEGLRFKFHTPDNPIIAEIRKHERGILVTKDTEQIPVKRSLEDDKSVEYVSLNLEDGNWQHAHIDTESAKQILKSQEPKIIANNSGDGEDDVW